MCAAVYALFEKNGLGKLPHESALQNDPDYRELRVIPVILFANNLTTGAVVVGHQVLKSSELGDAHLKSSQTGIIYWSQRLSSFSALSLPSREALFKLAVLPLCQKSWRPLKTNKDCNAFFESRVFGLKHLVFENFCRCAPNVRS